MARARWLSRASFCVALSAVFVGFACTKSVSTDCSGPRWSWTIPPERSVLVTEIHVTGGCTGTCIEGIGGDAGYDTPDGAAGCGYYLLIQPKATSVCHLTIDFSDGTSFDADAPYVYVDQNECSGVYADNHGQDPHLVIPGLDSARDAGPRAEAGADSSSDGSDDARAD